MDEIEKPTERSVAKWKDAARGGFQVLPDILLKKQVELGLSATDMLVLINISMHWWYEEQKPFPRTTTVAARMGVDPRTVQRSLQKLIDLSLVSKVLEDKDGESRQVLHLDGLVERLSEYVKTDADYLARQQRRREA